MDDAPSWPPPLISRFSPLDSNLGLQRSIASQYKDSPACHAGSSSVSFRSAAVNSPPQPLAKVLHSLNVSELAVSCTTKILRSTTHCELKLWPSASISGDTCLLPARLDFVPFTLLHFWPSRSGLFPSHKMQWARLRCRRQPHPRNCRWPAAHSCCLLYSSIVAASPRPPCAVVPDLRSRLYP